MIKRMVWAGLAVVCAGFVAACGGGAKTGGAKGTAASAAEPVEIVQKVRGENAALKLPAVRLVKTQADLQALGIESLEGLAVDWANQDVVVLALGEQPTGGFWADITGVQQVGDVLYVQGVASAPAADAMTTQQLTYPYAAAVIAETPATRALSDVESVEGGMAAE